MIRPYGGEIFQRLKSLYTFHGVYMNSGSIGKLGCLTWQYVAHCQNVDFIQCYLTTDVLMSLCSSEGRTAPLPPGQNASQLMHGCIRMFFLLTMICGGNDPI